MFDAICGIIIAVVNGFITVVDGAWSAIAPPAGVVQTTLDYLYTLNDWVPVSDGLVIVGLVGLMAGFSVVLKFVIKLVDWLPKGV
jgi:hypothetical protein